MPLSIAATDGTRMSSRDKVKFVPLDVERKGVKYCAWKSRGGAMDSPELEDEIERAVTRQHVVLEGVAAQ